MNGSVYYFTYAQIWRVMHQKHVWLCLEQGIFAEAVNWGRGPWSHVCCEVGDGYIFWHFNSIPGTLPRPILSPHMSVDLTESVKVTKTLPQQCKIDKVRWRPKLGRRKFFQRRFHHVSIWKTLHEPGRWCLCGLKNLGLRKSLDEGECRCAVRCMKSMHLRILQDFCREWP